MHAGRVRTKQPGRRVSRIAVLSRPRDQPDPDTCTVEAAAIIGTILRILTFPLTIPTLGLCSVIDNAALLKITDSLSSHLTIDSFFWTAIWAAIILSLVSVVLDLTVGRALRPAHSSKH